MTGVIRRFGWGMADQALSSATNFALAVFAARVLSPAQFGAYGLAFAVYLVILGLSRSLCTQPLVIRFSAADAADRQQAAREATGAALAFGLVAGLVCAMIGLVVGGLAGRSLVALGVVAPGLVLQDAWRFVFFTSARPKQAAVNDATWAAAQAVGFAALALAGVLSAPLLVLGWGGAAVVAAAAGGRQAGLRPSFRAARSWLRSHADLGVRFSVEFIGATGSSQLVVLVLGVVAGLAAVGSLRAAQVVFGPLAVLYMSMTTVAVPEAVRLQQAEPGRVVAAMRRLSYGLAGAGALFGIFAVFLPDAVGRQLLGESWADAQPVVLPMAVTMCAAGVVAGAATGLRSLAAASRSLRARLTVIPLTLAAGLAGSALMGARGAAAGFAVAQIVSAVVWWRSFLLAVAEAEVPASPSTAHEPAGIHAAA